MALNKESINHIIQEAFYDSQKNHFSVLGLSQEPMWEPPIIGYADGSDDLFQFFREDIGDFYWTPAEAFRKKVSMNLEIDSVKNEDLTVISLGFSQTKVTKKDQQKAEGIPSLRWFVTRGEWEAFIADLCSRMEKKLESAGIPTVAIDLISDFKRENSERYGLASNWSHRHTAYAAGLGTFGLSEGLITRQGKAMRFTSLLVETRLPADERPYKSHQQWCSFYANGTCGECMKRCPVNAITNEGHDKELCSAYLERLKKVLGPDLVTQSHYVSGCGLCQSRIPCQDGIPADLINSSV